MKRTGLVVAAILASLVMGIRAVHARNLNTYSLGVAYQRDIRAVYSFFQDSTGRVWLGTDEGLLGFDGHQFLEYPSGTGRNQASNLKQDKQGRIWFSNFTGQLFYLFQDTIRQRLTSYNRNIIQNYHVMRDGGIVYHTSLDSVLMYAKGDEPHQMLVRTSQSIVSTHRRGDTLYMVFFDSGTDSSCYQGAAYLLQEERLIRKERLKFRSMKERGRLVQNRGRLQLLRTTGETIGLYDLASGKEHWRVPTPGGTIGNINAISRLEGRFFIGTKAGFFPVQARRNALGPVQMPHRNVGKITRDREGNWCIHTLDKGLHICINPQWQHLPLNTSNLRFHFFDRDGGFYFVDDAYRMYRSTPPYDGREFVLDFPVAAQAIHYDARRQRLYLSYLPFYYQLPAWEKVQLAGTGRRSRFKDRVLLGDELALDIRTDELVLHHLDNEPVTAGDIPLAIGPEMTRIDSHFWQVRDKRGLKLTVPAGGEEVLIDAVDGLHHWNRAHPPRKLTLDGATVYPELMYADETEGIWVVTQNRQLVHYVGGKLRKRFSLPESVGAMTGRGPYLFLAGRNQILRYHKEDGPLGSWWPSSGWMPEWVLSMQCRKKRLYLVGRQHLQSIALDFEARRLPPLQLFWKGGRTQRRPIALDRDFELAPQENDLQIAFGAVSLSSMGHHYFEYRLPGVHDAWVRQEANETVARFLNLSPGRYALQLRACLPGGPCSPTEVIAFGVMAPFYKRWWFLVVLILGSGLLIAAMSRYYLQQQAQQHALQQEKERFRSEMQQSKAQALRAQMNPHFMFNALNTIQHFIFSDQKNVATGYLADFADLIRRFLDHSRDEEISLKEEMETLGFYLKLENLRLNQTLDYQINYRGEPAPEDLNLPTLLIQPFVENALKHGLLHHNGPRKLRIDFSWQEEILHCTVADNGIGRERAQQINQKRIRHRSFALYSIDERIRLYNYRRPHPIHLHIEDLYEENRPAGTRVHLQIPSSPRAASPFSN